MSIRKNRPLHCKACKEQLFEDGVGRKPLANAARIILQSIGPCDHERDGISTEGEVQGKISD